MKEPFSNDQLLERIFSTANVHQAWKQVRSNKGAPGIDNACDAKKHRDNKQASTDILDLLGICKMLLSCKGNCSLTHTVTEGMSFNPLKSQFWKLLNKIQHDSPKVRIKCRFATTFLPTFHTPSFGPSLDDAINRVESQNIS